MKNLYLKTQLENGLTILLKEIHSAPLISQWVWYRVGSKDEAPGITGISHWVEHMQFKGTQKFPASIVDKGIARTGGVWNAFTYLDWTAYFETMPAKHIDFVLEMEADRMQNSEYTREEVEIERKVIISERRGAENEPLFRLSEAVHQAAFDVHPYHNDVIGSMEDLRRITCDDLYNHYRQYYVPGNAVLTMAGDFDCPSMLARIEEVYGQIPGGQVPDYKPVIEPGQNKEREVSLLGPGDTTYISMDWHVPKTSDADFWALNVLDSLLTGPSSPNIIGGGISNNTSRLYKALVERGLAVSVSGGLAITVDPYLYSIMIIVPPDIDPATIISVVDEEISRLHEKPPPVEDIQRAVKQSRALFAYGSENITNQAAWLGFSEMFANYDWFLEYLDMLSEVTPLDVQTAAQKYFNPQNRVLGVYLSDNYQNINSSAQGVK